MPIVSFLFILTSYAQDKVGVINVENPRCKIAGQDTIEVSYFHNYDDITFFIPYFCEDRKATLVIAEVVISYTSYGVKGVESCIYSRKRYLECSIAFKKLKAGDRVDIVNIKVVTKDSQIIDLEQVHYVLK